jgi:sulfane dehydrogenase subunit SoxC
MVKALKDTMLAYGQNGEPITPQNGFPLRMLVPGFEALYSVKWIRRIKVVDRPYMGFQEIRQYTNRPGREQDERVPFFNYEMGPKSVITAPSGGHKLPGKGNVQITGLAWSGGGRITKVEVSTDNGRTWREAQIQGPAHSMAHTRFNIPWTWNGQETVIMSRCTDELGQLQPTEEQFAKYWGMTAAGLLSGKERGFGHHNSIQPWGIKTDGSVYNVNV